ncbi:hypothetical protein EBR25_13450 [bacterium]|nr:hypothetical protein [bacterium]
MTSKGMDFGGNTAVLEPEVSMEEISSWDQLVIDKANEFRREFHTLPNVLVQDPQRGCAYYMKADELAPYEASADTLARMDDGTVTFVIPDGEIFDEVPPYLRNPEVEPSVLIKYSHGRTSYFMELNDLEQFKIEQPASYFDDESISFIMPRGTELVEELPEMRRALLQSNTR